MNRALIDANTLIAALNRAKSFSVIEVPLNGTRPVPDAEGATLIKVYGMVCVGV